MKKNKNSTILGMMYEVVARKEFFVLRVEMIVMLIGD